MTNPVYIAMWSGPRNISTAMMRSWENRPDTIVHDEPFYAHYLTQTTYDHPGKDEIIATYQTDWQNVVKTLTGSLPQGKTIYYQKHMSHHLLDHMTIDWLDTLTNCFLIRQPDEMLTSLMQVFPQPTLDQTGLPQQKRIFDHIQQKTGRIPPVIDGRDVLENPREMLSLLCEAVDVPFDDRMLSWPAGKRDSDGIWAKYWYDTVEKSTGFAAYQSKSVPVPDHLQGLLAECNAIYQELHQHRLKTT